MNSNGRQISQFEVLRILIQREFWEHRVLWMGPLIVAGLLVACAFPARLSIGDFNAGHSPGPGVLFAWMQWGLTVPQYLVMLITLNFYLLDCLYAERKDRSILFWKSLPVSDAATVVAKLLVALIVVPLVVYLVAAVSSLLFSAVLLGRVSFGQLHPLMAVWDTAVWFKVQALMLTGLLMAAIWYAPLAAYLLLVSAWARRSVFLWATLPPLLAVVVEKMALGTHFVADLLKYRSWSFWQSLHLQTALVPAGTADPGTGPAGVFRALGVGSFVLNIDVWLGVAVTVACVFAAVRIRRYRDDT